MDLTRMVADLTSAAWYTEAEILCFGFGPTLRDSSTTGPCAKLTLWQSLHTWNNRASRLQEEESAD